MKRLKEKRLLVGFGLFFVLIIFIGVTGLLQINELTKSLEKLQYQYLPKERLILEMKINNGFYAMGVRNYVSWRISRYLQAAAIASDVNFIEGAAAKFRSSLSVYNSLSDTQEQKDWVGVLEGMITELEGMGKTFVSLTDEQIQQKEKVNRLLISFENKFYKIDDFLSNTLSKNNLKDIEKHLALTYAQKNFSILILSITLFFCGILGAVIASFVYRSLKEERRRREWLVQKMIRLEEEERKNLSRQVHDQLSQDLSGLKIYLDLIDGGILPEEKEQKKKIGKTKKILDDLIERGHNISALLRPPELDDLGLVESIGSLIIDHEKIMDCKFKYYKPVETIKVVPEHRLALYRVVQESLTNIVKHAQARNVTISLQQKGKIIQLAIVDDGVGFDYSQYVNRPYRRKKDKMKLGLQGLRERIEFLGGKLTIKTAEGEGTIVKVEMHY
jgi:signal transduction histidine kinase